MKAEIIAVGSELLLGQITNTNAQFISARLAEIGVDVYYHTVIGDNPERLVDAIKIAEQRADVLLFTGGLGPTKDDLTKEAIARHLGIELDYDDAAIEHITDYFERQGRVMTPNNKKQALVFKNSTVLKNYTGMAPGMAYTNDENTYILMPGPPHEMKPMFEKEVISYLLKLDERQEVIVSRVLNCFGIGEAELESRIETILETQTNPTVAPLASPKGVTLRLTAKATSLEEAYALIAPVEADIRAIIGEFVFGIDDETLFSKTVDLLQTKKLTIAAAESLTGGQFMSQLTSITGASAVFGGGMVVYSLEQKAQQLDLDRQALEEQGVVSQYCAEQMAEAVRKKFGTDIGVSLTGAAGPDSHDGQPAGTVWIGIAYRNQVHTYRLQLSGMRNTNRMRATNFAYHYLIQLLESEKSH